MSEKEGKFVSLSHRESREQVEHSSDIQKLQLQLAGKVQEARRHQLRSAELEDTVDDQRQLQHTIATREYALETKERKLQQTREQLRGSEQLVSEFQESLQQKDNAITELQRTISEHEKKIQQMEQGDTASRDT